MEKSNNNGPLTNMMLDHLKNTSREELEKEWEEIIKEEDKAFYERLESAQNTFEGLLDGKLPEGFDRDKLPTSWLKDSWYDVQKKEMVLVYVVEEDGEITEKEVRLNVSSITGL